MDKKSEKMVKLVTLEDRGIRDILILMDKVKFDFAPRYLADLFIKDDVNIRNLRSSDFRLPRYNTVRYGKHSVRFLGPLLWSRLTKTERNAQSLTAFKSLLSRKDLGSLNDIGCNFCYLCNS